MMCSTIGELQPTRLARHDGFLLKPGQPLRLIAWVFYFFLDRALSSWVRYLMIESGAELGRYAAKGA
jgi:hypothetical protein